MHGKITVTDAQRRRGQEMEAVGTLAGGIAHEFNNILMGIQGHVSLMLFHLQGAHPFHQRLKSMEKLVERGARLTTQLLGYARKGPYRMEPVALNGIIEKTTETFKSLGEAIIFSLHFADDLSVIEADTDQMKQVLTNLFVNAADAMPDGGMISVYTENTEVRSVDAFSFPFIPGSYVLLTVRDTGIGMDEATRERIFEPFFTTKGTGKGTGLGLAAVYGIVKGHGGYIDVQSRPNMGTTFQIYFPIAQPPAEVTKTTAESLLRGAETVLFVDDEEEILNASSALLEVMGYRVLTARTGREALCVYERQGNEIDIVLLDMIMPEMSGGQVFEQLKTINPAVRVLLLSGYSKDQEETALLASRCEGFIQKPFKIYDLCRSIREAMEGAPKDQSAGE